MTLDPELQPVGSARGAPRRSSRRSGSSRSDISSPNAFSISTSRYRQRTHRRKSVSTGRCSSPCSPTAIAQRRANRSHRSHHADLEHRERRLDLGVDVVLDDAVAARCVSPGEGLDQLASAGMDLGELRQVVDPSVDRDPEPVPSVRAPDEVGHLDSRSRLGGAPGVGGEHVVHAAVLRDEVEERLPTRSAGLVENVGESVEHAAREHRPPADVDPRSPPHQLAQPRARPGSRMRSSTWRPSAGSRDKANTTSASRAPRTPPAPPGTARGVRGGRRRRAGSRRRRPRTRAWRKARRARSRSRRRT